jgi:oxygen-dependent protoporphyrinogen oxidase
MSESTRVIVVGAGASGLVAAHTLRRACVAVTLLEASPWVGGRTRTEAVDGYAVDAGAQLYASMYSRVFGLLDELGRSEELVRSPGLDALWRDGDAHAVSFGSVASMITSGALGMRLKLRLGATYLPFLARHASALDIHAPERAAAAGLDVGSIAAWGEREMGREFVDSLVYPQLASYYGALPEETSEGFYHQLARHGTDVRLFAMRGGTGKFCEILAERLRAEGGDVRLGTPVASVKRRGGGVVVGGEGWEEEGAAAVLAVPAPAARALLGQPGTPLDDWLAGVRFRPSLTIALLLDRPVGVRYFGLSFARGESTALAALCVEENKGPGLVPEGRGLVVAFVRPESVPELIEADGRAVFDAIRPDLDRAFPRLAAHVARVKVYRWPVGSAVFYPGYLGRLGAFRGGAVEGDGPIALAGDYLVSPTIEGAVTSGTSAAERLLTRLRTRGRADI